MFPRINLQSEAFLSDRVTSYREFRKQAPLAYAKINDEDVLVVTRFSDADKLLRHRDVGVQPEPGKIPLHLGSGPAAYYYRLSVPSVDAPEHVRLRKIFNPLFGGSALASKKRLVEEIVGRAVAGLVEAGEAEFVESVAFAVPISVTCSLLDIPLDEASYLLGHMLDMTPIMSQAQMNADMLIRSDAAAQIYFDYFDKHLKRSAHLPEDTITGALIAGEKAGLLERDEVCCALMDVFIGAIHTTMTAFSNAVAAFAENPAEFARLRAEPGLAGSAWEEVLRFRSPVHFRHRYAQVDIDIDGTAISGGVKMMLALSSANLDDNEFTAADRFDVGRDIKRHLAFGGGGHTCLGTHLARMEGRALLGELASRVAVITLADKPIKRNRDLTFPHFEELHVKVIAS